ncbi:MAG: hypothetical protein ABSG55_03220 [Dehalococcoidia bacterium]|jgi:hypothetical protein
MVQPTELQQPARKRVTRVKAEERYPVYDLDSSIAVARAIREKGGGSADLEHIAGFLDYGSTKSGSFISRIAAARQFALIERNGSFYVPTRLANRIIIPEHPGVEDRAARAEAFMSVTLYKSLYQRYKGGPIPPQAGLRNALETQFNVPRARTQLAYRVFMESAGQAGFFDARGVRTHLVMPAIAEGPNISGVPTEDQTQGEDIGDSDQWTPPKSKVDTQTDINDLLRRVLVEKIREVPATDLEMIREYIKEIKELDESKEDEGG